MIQKKNTVKNLMRFFAHSNFPRFFEFNLSLIDYPFFAKTRIFYLGFFIITTSNQLVLNKYVMAQYFYFPWALAVRPAGIHLSIKIISVFESFRFILVGRCFWNVSETVSRTVFGSYDYVLDIKRPDGTKLELLTFKITQMTSSFRKRSIMIYELWITHEVQNFQFLIFIKEKHVLNQTFNLGSNNFRNIRKNQILI